MHWLEALLRTPSLCHQPLLLISFVTRKSLVFPKLHFLVGHKEERQLPRTWGNCVCYHSNPSSPLASPHLAVPHSPLNNTPVYAQGGFAGWPVTDSPWGNSESHLHIALSYQVKMVWYRNGSKYEQGVQLMDFTAKPGVQDLLNLWYMFCCANEISLLYSTGWLSSLKQLPAGSSTHSWCNNVLRYFVSLFQKTSKHLMVHGERPKCTKHLNTGFHLKTPIKKAWN